MKIRLTLFTGMLIITVPILLSGCASLTKSQLAAVNRFGQSTKDFSAVPGKLYSGYIDLHEQALVYAANKFTDPIQHFDNLEKAYQLKKEQLKLNAKLDLTFKIIDKYGQALVLLTSDKHGKQLDTAAQKAGSSFEDLVGVYNKINTTDQLPAGIGGLISGLISAGGNAYIHQKQAERVKELVPRADVLISKLMDELSAYLKGNFKGANGMDASYSYMLDAEKTEIRNDYIAFLGLHKEDVQLTYSSSSAGSQSSTGNARQPNEQVNRQVSGYVQQTRFATPDEDKGCIKMLSDLDALKTMYDQTLTAIDQLKKAHHQLTENIQEKKTLKDIIGDIEAYGNTVEGLYDTLKKIK